MFLGGWEESTIEAIDVLPPTHVQSKSKDIHTQNYTIIYMQIHNFSHPAWLKGAI